MDCNILPYLLVQVLLSFDHLHRRGGGAVLASKRFKAELLVQMDGLNSTVAENGGGGAGAGMQGQSCAKL